MKRRWLAGRTVALSVSPPQDMAERGMGPEHLTDALGEISRQLLSLGAKLMYGGHLEDDGITRMLFELVARYSPSLARKDEYAPMIIDVVPYPMHAEKVSDELITLESKVATIAELRYMSPDGDVWSFITRPRQLEQLPTEQWPEAFSAMRRYVTRVSDARIVLGGKTSGYYGRMPGIAEEAFISAMTGQPLFVVGGFGGAARAIAHSVAAHEHVVVPGTGERYLVETANGLDEPGLRRLAVSPHIDEIAVLLTRGLARLFAE
jgi:hypothetical protein